MVCLWTHHGLELNTTKNSSYPW